MGNLRISTVNCDGELIDITDTMENWIADWWFDCFFVPENDAKLLVAELDGESILREGDTFSDLAVRLNWDGLYDDFEGAAKLCDAELTAENFTDWLSENLR